MSKFNDLGSLNLYKGGDHNLTKVETSITLRGAVGMAIVALANALAHVLDGEMVKLDAAPAIKGNVPEIRFHFMAQSDTGKKARKEAIASTFQHELSLEALAAYTGREDRLAEYNKTPSANATPPVVPANATPPVVPAKPIAVAAPRKIAA